MGREKKITVRPFINDALKPSYKKGTREKLYPLYFRVTYDRKSTKFKAGDNLISLAKSQTFDEDPVIERSKEFVRQVVRYEYDRTSNFEIREIGQRIRSYLTNVYDLLWQDLNDELYYALCEKLSGGEVNAWQIISNQVDKINAGVKYLGEDLSERGCFLLYIINLFGSISKTNITIFEWIVLDEASNYLSKIDEAMNNSPSEFHVPNFCKTAERVTSPTDAIEAIQKYLYERIDLGIAYPEDWESGDYTDKGRVFEKLY